MLKSNLGGSIKRKLGSLIWLCGLVVVISLFVALEKVHQVTAAPELPSPPLKSLAGTKNVAVGNYASLKLLGEPAYKSILTSQYDFVSVDGELNWTFNNGSLRPSAGKFDFTNPDIVFNFASANNLPVQAHHLVWGEEKWLPAWLKNGNYSKAQLLELIHQHISEVSSHYKGRVREWTVANEAFTRGQHLFGLNDWWADHTGDLEYIDKSFIWAHQTDPNAKLLLNDFGNESLNSTSDAMLAYIKGMQQRGVPIDGIGMQMHIDGAHSPDKQSVVDNMRRFGGLGLGVYVTEFDVNMSGVSGNREQKYQVEAKVYRDMASACVESKVCYSFAELGVTDKDSWYNELGFKDAWPLPFDEKYQPKPAFLALRDVFAGP